MQNKKTGMAAFFGGGMLLVLVSIVLALITATVQHKYGLGKDGARLMIRITAAVSMILFMLLFLSGALSRYRPGRFSDWVADNRRFIGLSFATSHLVHGGFLLSLLLYGKDYFLSIVRWDTIVLGGLAYVIIFMMVFTSIWPVLMQRMAWLKPFYFYSMYYLWLIFFATFAERAWSKPVTYLPYVLITLAALWLNIREVRNRKR